MSHADCAASRRWVVSDPPAGWSAVLSNLKSLLETGHPLAQAPWEMRSRV